MSMSEGEWRRELERNPAKKDKGNKRDNQTEPKRDDNRRDDHYNREAE